MQGFLEILRGEELITYEVIPIKTNLIKPNADFFKIFNDSLSANHIELKNHDILIIAESVLATMQGRIIDLDTIKPSQKALQLAKEHDMDPRYVQVIIDESDKIYGGVKNVLLCKKEGNLLANAGIDQSNAPINHVVLLPNLNKIDNIRKKLETTYSIKIGLIIADSRTQPLRKGVIGLALAISGFEPVESFIGRKDLYGKELKYTYRAIADDLVSAAQIELGESNESVPFVIVRGVKVKFTDTPEMSMFMEEDECLYMNVFKKSLE
ncbi:MAG: coenzyme F420-0:L-glutamate ligase [Candidatus Lokiarchaeota archaeon]|nr:coenzyme F420-0:L-glutamate ligase [Candidatus Lokiarchaeota archaeon]